MKAAPHGDKRVSVLVLNWNGRHYLKRCLDSIGAQTHRNLEVILMDNGSTDGSAGYVRTNYPSVMVVETPRNLGTAEGNNVAARHATGDYLFLINNDAWLIEPDTISRLLDAPEQASTAAIIGCHIINADGSLQDIGAKIDRLGFPRGITPPLGGLPPVVDDLFFVCNCAVLMRADVFWELGGYDGRYFWSHEEVDLAWRARLRGYSVLTDTRAMVGHVGGGSMIGGAPGKERRYRTTTARIYFRERSTLATLLKNYSAWSLARVLPLYMCVNLLEILFFLLVLRPSISRQYLRAYWWNMKQLPSTLDARRRIQRERRVSDREIARYFWPGIRKLQNIKHYGMPRIEDVASGAKWDLKAGEK